MCIVQYMMLKVNISFNVHHKSICPNYGNRIYQNLNRHSTPIDEPTWVLQKTLHRNVKIAVSYIFFTL